MQINEPAEPRLEDIIQLLINRYIPYNIRKLNQEDNEVHIFLKDSKSESLFRIGVSFKINEPERKYSWHDFREECMIELAGLSKKEVLEKIKGLKLQDFYVIENEDT